jgi:hypothetical protein
MRVFFLYQSYHVQNRKTPPEVHNLPNAANKKRPRGHEPTGRGGADDIKAMVFHPVFSAGG